MVGKSGVTYELGHEGNHEVEKTDGLDESETQNGIGEELATEGGVAGNTVKEGSEDETDTDTSTSKTNGSRTHTQVLGDLNHGLGDLRGVGTALESLAGGGIEDRGGLLALEGLEGSGCKFFQSASGEVPANRSSRHTGEGTLAGVGDLDAHGRASDLGRRRGHLGGQSGGEHTGGGHCIWCGMDRKSDGLGKADAKALEVGESRTACVREEEGRGKGRGKGRIKWSACGTEARAGPGNGSQMPNERSHWPIASGGGILSNPLHRSKDHKQPAIHQWVSDPQLRSSLNGQGKIKFCGGTRQPVSVGKEVR